MDEVKDQEMMERLEKGVVMPEKPRLGTIQQWIFFVLYTLMVLIAVPIAVGTEDIAVMFIGGIFSLVGAVGFLIETYGIFVRYSLYMREYHWAYEDFHSYKKMMAKRMYQELTNQKLYSEDLEKSFGKKQRKPYSGIFFGPGTRGKIRP